MDLGLLRDLAHRCRRYSPLVGIDDSENPDTLFLDITGGAHLFGGEARMVRQVVADFRRWGFLARAAVANTVGAAWAMTRATTLSRSAPGPVIVLSGRELPTLSRLPVEALRISAEVAELLHALGLFTIGHLAALPRETLPSRFGPEILRRLDQALGHIPEPIVPERPEEPIEAAYGCEPPIENRAAIEIILQRLLERVMKKLRLRTAGILQLDVELTVSGKEPARFTVGLVRPSLDQKRLRELLRLQLDRVQLKGRLAGAKLRVVRTAPLEADQAALFETAERRHVRRDLDSLLNRLSNRLGPRAVLCPRLSSDYQPERAVEYATLGEQISQLKSRARSKRSATGGSSRLAAGAQRADVGRVDRNGRHRRNSQNVTRTSASSTRLSSPKSVEPLARNKTAYFVRGSLAARESLPRRPLRLFPEPVPVQVYSVVPDGPPIRLNWGNRVQQIMHCEGPERIDTGWWRWPAVYRDYFRADTEDGQRLWLFHARDEGSWFVHGEF